MCSSERPTSVGRRLNTSCAAGVRRRICRSRPTVTIARSALLMKLDRSSVSASSSRLRCSSCSLTVISSSLADCSSSLVVSSSSFVLCSSSLLDRSSSWAARSSWPSASCRSTIDCRYSLLDDSSRRNAATSCSPGVDTASSGRAVIADQSGASLASKTTARHRSCALRNGDWQNPQRELHVGVGVDDVKALAHDRRTRGERLIQGDAKVEEQPIPGHAQNVRGRLSWQAFRETARFGRGTPESRSPG